MLIGDIPATPCSCRALYVRDDRENCSCNQSDLFDVEFYKDLLTCCSQTRDAASPDAGGMEDADERPEVDDAVQAETGPANGGSVPQVPWDNHEIEDKSDFGGFLTGTDGGEADESETEWTEGGEGDASETTDTDTATKPKKVYVRGKYNKFCARKSCSSSCRKEHDDTPSLCCRQLCPEGLGRVLRRKVFQRIDPPRPYKKAGKEAGLEDNQGLP